MRTLPILLLAVALTAPTRADDPPHLAAAKKRQQAATAFETTLAVAHEWRNVVQLKPAPARRTVTDTSAARLVADGDRYRSELTDPVLSTLGLNRHALQSAYDGTWLGLRSEFEIDAPGVNQSQISRVATSGRADGPFRPRWHPLFDPLRLAYRGEVALAEAKATGKEEKIGGRVCREFAWPPRVGGGISVTLDGRPPETPTDPPVERVWLDTERDYLPVRHTDRGGRTTDVEYRADDRGGWVPVRWTAVETYADDPQSAARVTVTVESFAVREGVPADTFRVRFPPGGRVTVIGDDSRSSATVGDDGFPLLGEQAEKADGADTGSPSLLLTLAVVGLAVAGFAGLMVLVRRLARNRADQPAATG